MLIYLVCGTGNEYNHDLTLTTGDNGILFSSVVFASFGNPIITGGCGKFEKGTCDSAKSEKIVKALCVGYSSCIIPISKTVFGDACFGTFKILAVQLATVVQV